MFCVICEMYVLWEECGLDVKLMIEKRDGGRLYIHTSGIGGAFE